MFSIRNPNMPMKRIHWILLAAATLTPPAAGQTATLATLYSFRGYPIDAQSPSGALLLSPNGTLYGTTSLGGVNFCTSGAGCGTVYELKPPAVAGGASMESVIFNFAGCCPGAALPAGGLVADSNGALYGTAASGAGTNGSVFQLIPPATAGAPWSESVIWSATTPEGTVWFPQGPLLAGPGGTLYGTTSGIEERGQWHGATAFALTPPAIPGESWTESTMHYFDVNSATGTDPRASVVYERGSFFGTLYLGGQASCLTNGCGAVFELRPTPAGGASQEGTIYKFQGPPLDGANPATALTAGPGGVFYGTTFRGGAGTLCAYYTVVTGCGTVFQLTQAASGEAWTETVLHSFKGLDGDGAFPAGSLVVGGNGSLYGTTQYGGSATFGSPCTSNGASGCGTAFVLTPPAVPGGAWTESVLHSFTGTNGDGAIPEGPLLLSPTGVLYGTTSAGGTANYGTVFSLMLN